MGVFQESRHAPEAIFFLDDEGDPNDFEVLSPAEILQTIFEYAQEMGLFKAFPEGSRIIRARWEEDGERHETSGELGPPREDKATQANRMSPAGIPMFYGCDDEDTALREAASGPGLFAVGEFETVRPAVLLDLTDIPDVPGLFEDVPDFQAVDPRRALMFLHHVAGEMSRRIERDDRVHIKYVPTQVVTEFIRAKVIWGESKVDGIRVFAQIMVRGLMICSSLLAKPKTPGYRMIHTAFGWACWRLAPDVA